MGQDSRAKIHIVHISTEKEYSEKSRWSGLKKCFRRGYDTFIKLGIDFFRQNFQD